MNNSKNIKKAMKLYSDLEKLLNENGDMNALSGMIYLSEKYGIKTNKTIEYIENKVREVNKKAIEYIENRQSKYTLTDPVEGRMFSEYIFGRSLHPEINLVYGFGEMTFGAIVLEKFGKPAIIYASYFISKGISRAILKGMLPDDEWSLYVTHEIVLHKLVKTPIYKYVKKHGLKGIEDYIKGDYKPPTINYILKYDMRERVRSLLYSIVGIVGSAMLTYNTLGESIGLASAGVITTWLVYNNIKLLRDIKGGSGELNLTLGDLEKKIFG